MSVGANYLKRYKNDTSGGFAIVFAVGLMLLMVSVGAAYDLANVSRAKSRLQDAVDTAALAGASAARTNRSTRKTSARETLISNIELDSEFDLRGRPRVVFNEAKKEVTVTAKVKVKTAFMGIIGVDRFVVEAKSTSGYAIESMNPFAIMLALDVSGSMAWVSTDGEVKLDALKSATDEMFQSLYSSSENKPLLLSTIRTGFASYEANIAETLDLRTGYYDTVAKVKRLTPLGGTNSTPAVQYAYDQLVSEKASQSNWSGYLVFMSDGDNNEEEFDAKTIALCDKAKADNIMIFTVAFEAPKKGEALLKSCATSKKNFYKSGNAKKLRKAFRHIGREISQSVVRIKH